MSESQDSDPRTSGCQIGEEPVLASVQVPFPLLMEDWVLDADFPFQPPAHLTWSDFILFRQRDVPLEVRGLITL